MLSDEIQDVGTKIAVEVANRCKAEVGACKSMCVDDQAEIYGIVQEVCEKYFTTPAEPTVPVQDVEVEEIEKRHDLYEERRARAPSDRDYMDCLVMHGHRATLLRYVERLLEELHKLRALPTVQDADLLKAGDNLAALMPLHVPEKSARQQKEAISAWVNLRKLRASSSPATIDRKQLARWFFDRQATNHGLKFEEEPDETEAAYELADRFIADIPRYEIASDFISAEQTQRSMTRAQLISAIEGYGATWDGPEKTIQAHAEDLADALLASGLLAGGQSPTPAAKPNQKQET